MQVTPVLAASQFNPIQLDVCRCALLALFRASREDQTFLFFFEVFGRFSAKVGPRSLPNGPGSEMLHKSTKINPGDRF